ncbi:MAG TPA: glycosyltransferase family 39 protein [Acidimicrobiales bacterium]|nr:glycosyltransferase family 39 protein [Acidimicrobiales bacterium]
MSGGIGVAAPPCRVDRRVFAVAAALFAVLMALSNFYGFDRDELYFLDAARHLQGGYVDQPVLVPLLARVSLALFGVSLPGLRMWPALAAAATVVVAALLAREFGGGRRAQLLAATATATMPAVLGADHLMGPTAIDILAWGAFALVVVRIGRTGDPRWWVVAGVVLGVGLANKHSVGFFALAVVVGVLLSGGGRALLNRWFLVGAVIAGLFTVPDLLWQAGHGWATIAMTRQLNAANGGAGNIGNWVVGQLIMTTLALVWLWMVGLRELWGSGQALWRALVWAYGLLFVFFAATTGAKIYYLAGAYSYLLGAGAVRIESWLEARPKRQRRLFGWTALTTATALPLVLPVLPAADIGWTYSINQVPAETVGWPEFLATVSHVWNSLPAAQRSDAVIFTANYGEAGAINELGGGYGLPGAVSGHNNEWFWGPGNPHASTVVAVAPGPRDVTGYGSYLSGYFRSVRVAATITNTAGLHNQEWGGHVYTCTLPRRPWGRTWPSLRHYN